MINQEKVTSLRRWGIALGIVAIAAVGTRVIPTAAAAQPAPVSTQKAETRAPPPPQPAATTLAEIASAPEVPKPAVVAMTAKVPPPKPAAKIETPPAITTPDTSASDSTLVPQRSAVIQTWSTPAAPRGGPIATWTLDPMHAPKTR